MALVLIQLASSRLSICISRAETLIRDLDLEDSSPYMRPGITDMHPNGETSDAQPPVELQHLPSRDSNHRRHQFPDDASILSGKFRQVKLRKTRFTDDLAGSSDDAQTSQVSIDALALVRYNSAWAVAKPISANFHFSLALFLMVLFILVVIFTPLLTPEKGYC